MDLKATRLYFCRVHGFQCKQCLTNSEHCGPNVFSMRTPCVDRSWNFFCVTVKFSWICVSMHGIPAIISVSAESAEYLAVIPPCLCSFREAPTCRIFVFIRPCLLRKLTRGITARDSTVSIVTDTVLHSEMAQDALEVTLSCFDEDERLKSGLLANMLGNPLAKGPLASYQKG